MPGLTPAQPSDPSRSCLMQQAVMGEWELATRTIFSLTWVGSGQLPTRFLLTPSTPTGQTHQGTLCPRRHHATTRDRVSCLSILACTLLGVSLQGDSQRNGHHHGGGRQRGGHRGAADLLLAEAGRRIAGGLAE